jgi:hypothetical protein
MREEGVWGAVGGWRNKTSLWEIGAKGIGHRV